MTKLELTNTGCGESLQSPINTAITENNSVLEGSEVHYLFRGSRVNLKTGRHGIRWFIAEILTAALAEFKPYELMTCKRDNEDKPIRNEKGDLIPDNAKIEKYLPVYIAYGLTTDQIIHRIREEQKKDGGNGSIKYPDKTIRQNLSVIMARDLQVAYVEATASEEQTRRTVEAKEGILSDSLKPRVRWYLVAE